MFNRKPHGRIRYKTPQQNGRPGPSHGEPRMGCARPSDPESFQDSGRWHPARSSAAAQSPHSAIGYARPAESAAKWRRENKWQESF